LANEQQTAFISYARQDSSEFALQLAEDLKAAGAAVWLDQLDIVEGELWDNAVQQAMTSCPRMCDYARGLRGLLRTLLAQPPSEQANPPLKRSLPIASEERRLEAEAQIKASHFPVEHNQR